MTSHNETQFTVKIYSGEEKESARKTFIHIQLFDDTNSCTRPIPLNLLYCSMSESNIGVKDFDSKDIFPLTDTSIITEIKIWQDSKEVTNVWYINRIEVKNQASKEIFQFPVYRWIQADVQYTIKRLDTSLPKELSVDVDTEETATLMLMRTLFKLDKQFSEQYRGMLEMPIQNLGCPQPKTNDDDYRMPYFEFSEQYRGMLEMPIQKLGCPQPEANDDDYRMRDFEITTLGRSDSDMDEEEKKQLDLQILELQENYEKERKKCKLERLQAVYKLDQKFPGGPCQVKDVPSEEKFKFSNKIKIFVKKIMLQITSWLIDVISFFWTIKKFDDLHGMYEGDFYMPEHANYWMSDEHFAMQRLTGVNHSIIELATSIPSKFPVTDAILEPLLEGLKIAEAIDQKRLFICDLQILDGLTLKAKNKLCAPIALFFVDKSKKLKPVAIQLNQRPGINNPIFTPLCPKWTWTLVKMWFNHSDAAYHQALTHLGFTHLMMEGFALATVRQLTDTHSVYKILAPHFLYLHDINSLAQTELLADGAWVDQTTSYGNKGMCQLIKRGFEQWTVENHGILPNDLKRRGVEDPNILPDYHFRDDALLLYDAIEDYVKSYLDLYYKDSETLETDWEIQNWAKELVKERNYSEGGMGILGLPGNGSLTSLDQLKDIVACVIFISSVGHAATNFPQYDQYGFPPNYPLTLSGDPPTNPRENKTEHDAFKALPSRYTMLAAMTITRVLSTKDTNSLGDFEYTYINDERARVVVNKFRRRLKEISDEINTRNMERKYRYNYLDPISIPNAISI